MLDSSHMESSSPQYARMRQDYLFSGLAQKDFDALMKNVTRITLDKGDVLFHRGDAAKYFYFVDIGHDGQNHFIVIGGVAMIYVAFRQLVVVPVLDAGEEAVIARVQLKVVCRSP